MLNFTSALMDWALIIGVLLLGMAILGGIFHFLRLGIYSACVNKAQAGVISGVLIVLTAVFIYQKFF